MLPKKHEARGKEGGRGAYRYEVKVRIEWGRYDGMEGIRNKREMRGKGLRHIDMTLISVDGGGVTKES